MSEVLTFLVRHGEPTEMDYRKDSDPGINLDKLEQLKHSARLAKAAMELRGVGAATIVSSNLLRAQETAAVFAEELANGVKVVPDGGYSTTPGLDQLNYDFTNFTGRQKLRKQMRIVGPQLEDRGVHLSEDTGLFLVTHLLNIRAIEHIFNLSAIYRPELTLSYGGVVTARVDNNHLYPD